MTVGIIGLGYVGLTLALALSSRGIHVFGVERDKKILDTLNEGRAHFEEKNIHETVALCKSRGTFDYGSAFDDREFDYCIITVGTPIDSDQEISFEPLLSALDGLPQTRSKDFSLILRSTIAVGTTKAIVEPICQRLGVRNVAFCPERTIEGKALTELFSLPQIIGASNREGFRKSAELFSSLGVEIISAPSLEIAELAKLYNNTYRDITFALGNYFCVLAQQYGSNGLEALRVANESYERGGIPSPGFVGGPCLEKDPYILSYNRYMDHPISILYEHNFVRDGRGFNEGLIKAAATIIRNRHSEHRILVSGMAFKGRPETSDLRGSPSLKLVELISKDCSTVYVHDFVAYNSEMQAITKKTAADDLSHKQFDVLIIANNHREYQTLEVSRLKDFHTVYDLAGALSKGQMASLTNVKTLGDIFL